MPTPEQTRKHNRRQALIAAGLCVQCGSRPVAPNKDGKPGLKCAEHKVQASVKYSTTESAGTLKDGRYEPTRFDGVDAPDYRDSERFKAYCMQVNYVLTRSNRPLTIREIHKGLGLVVKREWTLDALDSLPVERIVGYIDRYMGR